MNQELTELGFPRITITEDDLAFTEIIYSDDPNCICSRCACLISDGMFSVIFEGGKLPRRQYRYHPSCVALDDWFLEN